MTLQVRFVQDLSEIVGPVANFLAHDVESLGLFESQHVIVPTAGVRAWLVPQLARRLGAAEGREDGIVSNVRFGYVGALNALLRNGVEDDSDAWSIDHITMALVHVLSNDSAYDWIVKKYDGTLRAARAIADRFDRYAARRPHMIRAWERGSMMIPGVNVADAAEVDRFRWQFELWTKVREVVGVPSWPARSEEVIARLHEGTSIDGLPRRLMVAGLESISASNLEVLGALGNVIHVDALFVHPSPELRDIWSRYESQHRLESREVPVRNEDFVTPNVDQLASTWMRGSFELQMLLASQGISATHIEGVSHSMSDNLLARMKQTLASPVSVTPQTVAPSDLSVQIHRAHNLARQVEILHDALLHAFTDMPDLQPHEVLVLCADIASAAPLLQATFDRSVTLADGRNVKLPFVVADRSLRDVSDGAELLGDILSVVQSRFDIDSVLKVATSPLVLKNFSLDDSDVSVWIRVAELTRVCWGLDVEQRTVKGLDAPTITAHSWQHALERAVLGALVPDAEARLEVGAVVPLTHVAVADMPSLAGLIGVLSPLVSLELAARHERSVGEWCDLVETGLIELCGSSSTGIDDALEVIAQFRRATKLTDAADGGSFDDPVLFDEFADLIQQLLTTAPGRQPLRTGAITATSFVPLRSVPFRVVCVLGLDDGTLPAGDVEGDDLAALQPLMGDADSRLEVRRVLLDAVLAAQDRLLITCIGRSIKNNASVPLVTPLAELVDFCVRLGVGKGDDKNNITSIERRHPRHQSGARNFITDSDAIIPGRVWSHDVAARSAAESLNKTPESTAAKVEALAAPVAEFSVEAIENLFIDPAAYYLSTTLKIRKEYDDDDDTAATLPTSASKYDVAKAAASLDEMLDTQKLDDARPGWEIAIRASELLPVEPFAMGMLDEAADIAAKICQARIDQGLKNPRIEEVRYRDDDGLLVTGSVDHIYDDVDTVAIVRYYDSWQKDLLRLAVRVLLLCASGSTIRKGVMIHKSGSSNNASVRTITLADSIDQETAKFRLNALLKAEPIARTIPCPKFGETAEKMFLDDADEETVAHAFEIFTENSDSSYSEYKNSTEYRVYGDSPDFVSVYSARRATMDQFFRAYFSFIRLVDRKDKRDWEIAE